MDQEKWVYVSVGYSLIAFFTYFIMGLYQNYVFSKRNSWNVSWEVSVYVIFYTLYTFFSYTYYRSDIIKGIYGFSTYFKEIVVNIILILTPLLFFVRRYALKLLPPKETVLTIRGDNKLDILKINKSDLVCISNAQNYVEIFFLDNNTLKSKLIRSSLKRMLADFDFLMQIHRSHLINPSHFKSWKDASNIELTQMELPVSKNYKHRVLSI